MAERMAEEWQAHLDATLGSVAQTMVAAGFLIAAVQCKLAVKLARSDWSTPIAIRVLAAVLLLFESPIFLIVPLLIKLGSPGPVFVWSSHPGRAAYFPTFPPRRDHAKQRQTDKPEA
jgi:lipopolysaccharide/colanic/teichoic acid biosynthesis glycosyltransferase